MIQHSLYYGLVVLIVFLDMNALAKNIQCPQNFEAVGSSCYFLSNTNTIKFW
jgi:hypothetical protein